MNAPATPSRVSDVLDRAADLIEPEGAWHQGNYVGPTGDCWCALGAIMRVGNFASDINAPSIVLRRLIGEEFVADWNDDPERTQAEVVAKLREAAALAREQGK